MDYLTFINNYSKIIEQSIKKLKNNSFACFVVGDYRDKKTGNYVGFVADTIKAFQAQKVELYNDMVLVNVVASASFRAPAQMRKTRKVVKTHQNVLVFIKGNPQRMDDCII